jgi:hypothetical protein
LQLYKETILGYKTMIYLTFRSTTAVTAVTVKTTSGNPTDMIQYNSSRSECN